MNEEIEIIIDKDGTVHMEAIDFKGKECHDVLDKIRRQIGKTVKISKKSEFYKNSDRERDRSRS